MGCAWGVLAFAAGLARGMASGVMAAVSADWAPGASSGAVLSREDDVGRTTGGEDMPAVAAVARRGAVAGIAAFVGGESVARAEAVLLMWDALASSEGVSLSPVDVQLLVGSAGEAHTAVPLPAAVKSVSSAMSCCFFAVTSWLPVGGWALSVAVAAWPTAWAIATSAACGGGVAARSWLASETVGADCRNDAWGVSAFALGSGMLRGVSVGACVAVSSLSLLGMLVDALQVRGSLGTAVLSALLRIFSMVVKGGPWGVQWRA